MEILIGFVAASTQKYVVVFNETRKEDLVGRDGK